MTKSTLESLSLFAFLHLQNGQWTKAATLLEALTLFKPDSARISRSLAFAYLQCRRDDDCLRQTEDHLRRFPSDLEETAVRRIRSRALWRIGRPNEARRGLKSKMYDGLPSPSK